MIDYGEYSDGGTDAPLAKYILFAGNRYYPSEGAGDLRATADDMEYLRELGNGYANDGLRWWQICDSATLRVLEKGETDD